MVMAWGQQQLAFLTLALGLMVSGCTTTPTPASAPYPSAVIADADNGSFTLEFDPSLTACPDSVPVRTRTNGKIVDGFFLPPNSIGSQRWITKPPSDKFGIGSLFIPVSVESNRGEWVVQSGEFSFVAATIRQAASTPLPASISVVKPGGRQAGPPSFPGIMLAV